MRNILLTIQYDGTRYCGWQIQPDLVSIEEMMNRAIFNITGEKSIVYGSGRTDAKVHALGQRANFFTKSSVPVNQFPDALNTKLPRDIQVVDAMEVGPDFHARYSAVGKTYQYYLLNRKHASPLMENRVWHIRPQLDVKAMRNAAACFIGKKDFMAFMSKKGSAKTTVREIYRFTVEEMGDVIRFEVYGNGFLYNMVRIMVGTLVHVGLGKLAAEDIPLILKSRDRDLARKTAKPEGLYLKEVFYENLAIMLKNS